MKGPQLILYTAAVFLFSAALHAQTGEERGQGRTVVTVLPSGSGERQVDIQPQDVQVKVNSRETQVTGWTPLNGPDAPVELVLLIDDGARSSLGTQMNEIEKFVKDMPPGTKMAIAYMRAGSAQLAGSLSSNPADVLNGLRLPAGTPGASASPYFCLSDLARNWPSQDRSARRVAVMITNGVDNYNNPRFDLDNPYVQSAIRDSVRAGVMVYSLYWGNPGQIASTQWTPSGGQSLLFQVTEATGGYSYWQGFGNPVSFRPYFEDLHMRLRNQYELSFAAPLDGKSSVERLQVNVKTPRTKVDAPNQVLIRPAAQARGDWRAVPAA